MNIHFVDQSKILTSNAPHNVHSSHFIMHVNLCPRALVGIQAYSFTLQSVFAKLAIFLLENTLAVFINL